MHLKLSPKLETPDSSSLPAYERGRNSLLKTSVILDLCYLH